MAIPSTENKISVKLSVIIKADVAGSLQAILSNLPAQVNVIYSSTGDITESDVLLAKTSKAIIIGFNIKTSSVIEKLAEEEKIFLKTYQIIYELLDDLKKALIEPEPDEEKIKGRARMIAEFPYENKRVAGCLIVEGVIAKGDNIRVERSEKTVGAGKVKSIRKFKQETQRAEVGTECGIFIEPQVDFLVGDMLISIR